METVTRNVRDIGRADRQALEHLIGRHLADDQRLVIHVMSMHMSTAQAEQPAEGSSSLPAWCNVYEGLTDEAISSVEATILTRADLTRAAQ